MTTQGPHFVFPKWTGLIRPSLAIGGVLIPMYVLVVVVLAASPKTSRIGYMPAQPVPYDHSVHAGKLGMDCRYCHNTVEDAAHAAIPPTQTCMNCHSKTGSAVYPDSAKLTLIHDTYSRGESVKWVRVHDLPEFVYFNHSAHVQRGVGCVECHGRVDKMPVVYQDQPLTMSWCLDCHRNPDSRLRPKEFVTAMDWVPDEDPALLGARLREEYNINPSTDCSTCHR